MNKYDIYKNGKTVYYNYKVGDKIMFNNNYALKY